MLTKEKKIILIGMGIVAVAAAVFIIPAVITSIREQRDDPAINTVRSLRVIPDEDTAIFSSASLSQFKRVYGWQNIYRRGFNFDVGTDYELSMVECPLGKDGPLPGLLHFRQQNSRRQNMLWYSPNKLWDHGEFAVRLCAVRPLHDIFLNYSGGEVEMIVANDSLLHCRFLCKSLSIRYAEDSAADIVLTNEDGESDDLHVDALFVKHHDNVYFLFLTPIDYKRKVDPIDASTLLRR